AHAAPGLLSWGRRRRPERVDRLLIAHHLLLGDTVMLTALLKKARTRFPEAEIAMTVPRAYGPLYGGRPYGVKVLPFDPRSLADHAALRDQRGFDLALVPGDNRWSWLAGMLKARWIVAFASDRSSYKDVPVDEFVRMPGQPLAWGDIAAQLLEGPEPEGFHPSEWPAPPFAQYPQPRVPYGVLHLGASSPHKRWPPERWRGVLDWAESRGYEVVLSAGRGEESLLAPVDPEGRRSALAGRLDLAQLWQLLSRASFLVCPDTGVAHLARLVGVPTVAIYGPGSPISTGPGRFWASSPFQALWDPEVPCRDQQLLFERRLPWMRQCWRSVTECGDPMCIRRVGVQGVLSAIESLTLSRANDQIRT
ncbi:MAG: heptosyltransferase, partial [Microvirga sp.]|nr:heptosyltransferase [Microvirga sp.]